ncbi:MAG: peptidylprolyl isomerase [Chloroflexi bacterium]|nr:peptidylprolyl isomerase [Chloroflexota bacterium]
MARQRNPVIVRPSQRRQQSRWQRERGRQRAVIVAGAIAVLFILAIPAYGYWANFVAPPRSVVLQVDNTKYTLGFLTNYLKGVQALGNQLDMSVAPFQTLILLQENEIMRSLAAGKGIVLNPSEVDQELRTRILGSSPDAANTPADQLEREFKEKYRQYLSTAILSDKEYRRLVEASLLRDKLTEVLGEEVPTIAKQAKMSWIIVSLADQSDEDAAASSAQRVTEVSNRLKNGEDFATVAEALSDDRDTAVKGGEYGWVPKDALGTLGDTVFSLQPGETSDVVYGDNYAYFIKVTEVDEARTIEPEMMDMLKRGALQKAVEEERGNHRISSCFGGGSAGGACDWQYDWLVKRMRETAPTPNPSG